MEPVLGNKRRVRLKTGLTYDQNFSSREVDAEIPGSAAGAITRTGISHEDGNGRFPQIFEEGVLLD